jgi:predicted PurR-regulated permease PerM
VDHHADVAAPRESLVRRALPTYLALLFAILTLIGFLLLRQLSHVLLILFVSVLFAAALSGPAERLERLRVPRAIAVVLLYLAALAIVAVTLWLVVPPLFEQVAAFADRAPEYAERYGRFREAWNALREDYPALGSFDDQVSRLTSGIIDRAGNRIIDLPALLFALFLDALSVLVISMLLVTNRERLFGFALSLVHPTDRELVGSLLDKMWSRIGFYLRAKVIVMAIVGAITYGALLLIGVPFPLPLAVIVALGEAIPRAGPWLARIPLLAIAALDGLTTFGLTLAASVAIENGKGYVISPVVEGRQLDIHPLLVFVSVLAGAALGGFAGAFVAVPVAAILQILVEDVVIPWRRRTFAGEAQPSPPAGPGP